MTTKWKIAQWFELRWWKNYLRSKDKTTYLQWKKSYWHNILGLISTEVKIDTTETICDLGCGPAGIFIALPNNKVTAVDPLINDYEKQLTFFTRADYPNVEFAESTIEDFGGRKKYDIVFCLNAINHVYDIEKGFAQLKNISAANGQVVVSIDAHNYSFFKYLFRTIPGDVLHPHQYDLAEYKAMLEKQSMQIQKTILLKQEFFFTHYLLVAKTGNR